MTTEERLARLEAQVEAQQDTLNEIKVSVSELVKAMHTGRGALWLLLKIGAILLGLIGLAKIALDVVKP